MCVEIWCKEICYFIKFHFIIYAIVILCLIPLIWQAADFTWRLYKLTDVIAEKHAIFQINRGALIFLPFQTTATTQQTP